MPVWCSVLCRRVSATPAVSQTVLRRTFLSPATDSAPGRVLPCSQGRTGP
ncbi:hypothetical protein STVIR_5131 [Streptomyces viridochromogenes Tue57]|uniref:Uncharacterized protein n=1 Tax=Streptomyces viridochromogenes Tue57 TaxID=1160705 RepID=L8PEV3_STRVR|nr:hypothetical protein STVIR_5131 [Streptomyces viridochromogenes Tue57]